MCVFSPYSVLFEVDAEMEEPDLEAGTAKDDKPAKKADEAKPAEAAAYDGTNL